MTTSRLADRLTLAALLAAWTGAAWLPKDLRVLLACGTVWTPRDEAPVLSARTGAGSTLLLVTVLWPGLQLCARSVRGRSFGMAWPRVVLWTLAWLASFSIAFGVRDLAGSFGLRLADAGELVLYAVFGTRGALQAGWWIFAPLMALTAFGLTRHAAPRPAPAT